MKQESNPSTYKVDINQLNDKTKGTAYSSPRSSLNKDSNAQKQSIKSFSQIILEGLSNLSSVLDNWKDGKISKEETMAILIASTQESIQVAERSRILAIEEMMKNKYNEDPSVNENLFEDPNDMLQNVPALTQMGVPITTNAIRTVAKELAILHGKFREKKLLHYKTFNGYNNSLLVVPNCKTKESFVRSNLKQRFVDELPIMISGDETNKELQSEISGWLIKRLGMLYGNKLIDPK